jgi:UDP-N-acetyl-2-amino-2-deoxyglucuronate dehydrogenase
MKNFALIGAAGYIAPRHMKAIKDCGANLVAAFDPFDSVGIIDSHFPEAQFYTKAEQFEAGIESLRRAGTKIDYFSICSPNYMHNAHIRMALRYGADVLCEKPLVLEPEELDVLKDLEQESGHRVWTVLQLRAHPVMEKLFQEVQQSSKKHEVTVTYIATRGSWYLTSWKGDIGLSGGLASNIGIHFFDMLTWLFGSPQHLEVHERSEKIVSGYLELDKANVRWFLSIDPNYIPQEWKDRGQKIHRSITIDGSEIEFSEGFTDLHKEVYLRTMTGNGFSIDDTRDAISIISQVRSKSVIRVAPHLHDIIQNFPQ